MAKQRKLKAQQLVFAQWSPNDSPEQLCYSTFALSVDGGVYRYDPQCEGWIEWPMTISNCRARHPHKR